MIGLVKERLSEADAERGFILDGMPRNTEQARKVQEILGQIGKPLELAVHLDVDFDTVLKRLGGRRVCESCGATYNIHSSPPKFEDRCDECGGELIHRSDDKDETIANRMRVYDQVTDPVLGYYRERGLLTSIDGSDEPGTIFEEIDRVIVENCEIPPALVVEIEEEPSMSAIEKALIESLSADIEDSSKVGKLKNVAKGDEKEVIAKPKKKKTTKKKTTSKKKTSASGKKTKAKKKKAAVKKKQTAGKKSAKKAKAKEKVMRKKKSAAKKKSAVKKKKSTAKKRSGVKKKKKAGVKKKAGKKKATKKKAKKKTTKKKAAKKKGRKKKK